MSKIYELFNLLCGLMLEIRPLGSRKTDSNGISRPSDLEGTAHLRAEFNAIMPAFKEQLLAELNALYSKLRVGLDREFDSVKFVSVYMDFGMCTEIKDFVITVSGCTKDQVEPLGFLGDLGQLFEM